MIYILTTGGTIEGIEYGHGNFLTPRSGSIIESIIYTVNLSFEYMIEEVFFKDSRFINAADRCLIGEKVKLLKENKILITHGTISMVETAKFLGKLNLGKTIVLTGAFILGTKPNSDSTFNLGYAISALQFLDHGVYIVMNGEIFHWDNVRKNHQVKRFETL